MNYDHVPGCTYCDPEIGSVGLTEAEAKQRGFDVRVGSFPFGVLGRAKMAGETEGFVKIVADRKYDEVLGVHMIGPRSTELVAEAVLALRLECTVEELIRTIHAHPTFSEAVGEAAHATHGAAIHALERSQRSNPRTTRTIRTTRGDSNDSNDSNDFQYANPRRHAPDGRIDRGRHHRPVAQEGRRAVDRDEPLFEISTDKVDAEIPSPAAGVLREITAHEGETVAVNSVVASIAAAGEARLQRRPRRPCRASLLAEAGAGGEGGPQRGREGGRVHPAAG